MVRVRTTVTEGGRVVIPAEYRKALGMKVGDSVVLQFEDGELRIFTLKPAIRRAQEIVRRYVPQGRSLSDELITERYAEPQPG